jgi:hypothetical protein
VHDQAVEQADLGGLAEQQQGGGVEVAEDIGSGSKINWLIGEFLG